MSRVKAVPFPYLSRNPLTPGEAKYAELQLKKFKQVVKQYNKSIDTPEKALEILVATGMYTKTGKLKKQFR